MKDYLTIILTLKDRAPFTLRWMQYMNDVRCPYRILIADGGADARIEATLRDASNYPFLHYTYVRYPFDKDYQSYYRKFASAIASVTTPYVLLADNDDFYVMEHIPAFLRFLEDNDDYVSCGGRPITVHLMSEANQPCSAPAAREYVAFVDDRPKSVTQENGPDRLCYFLNNVEPFYLWSCWYQIHRTSALQDGARFLCQHQFTDPVAVEIHMHVHLLLAGKYKTFEQPLLLAQVGTSQSTASLNASANLVERFIEANAFNDIHRSLNAVTPALAAADKTRMLRAVARWFADTVFVVYPPRESLAAAVPVEGTALRMYRRVRRALRPVKRWWLQPPPPPPPLRLPGIEKYILEGGNVPNETLATPLTADVH